jgi:hypothetical protein
MLPNFAADLLNWPVRDQGIRDTCVAHALVACREIRTFQDSTATPRRWVRLSEQFLHWGAKHRDGALDVDGTLIKAGCDALALTEVGVCEAGLWPYQETPLAGQHAVTHADPANPSAGALANALSYRVTTNYAAWQREMPPDWPELPEREPVSERVLRWLEECGSVAVSVEVLVLVDPTVSGGLRIGRTNWENDLTAADGRVLDPDYDRSIGIGFMPSLRRRFHAVCVLGREPAPSEVGGWWFVFRNSAGPGWCPSGQLNGVPLLPGHGYFSAAYVDRYGQEVASIRAHRSGKQA